MFRATLAAVVLCGWLSATAAPAPPPVTGPRITDEQFFGLVDVSRPELAEVKAAIDRSDWSAAKHGLAEYFRTRQSPRWGLDPRPIGREPSFRSAGADDALKHRFTSINIPWQFGEKIDWTFNPTTQPDSKWPQNHEWTWQLSRHAMWLDLGRAFYATGDEKYAREFVAELRSWVQDCPVPLDAPANVAFSRWRTIEAGLRAGTVWPEVFPRFLAAKAFDDNALVLMLKSFVEHAQYLTKFHREGNWLTMEANGLYHLGALFPEFTEAKLWRETALGRLYRELDKPVYPDGAQIELAPGYHGVALRNFLGPVDLVPLTGFEVPGDYLAKMEKMFAYFRDSMQPDRTTPPLSQVLEEWMTCAFLPDYRSPAQPGLPAPGLRELPHAAVGMKAALETLRLYPVDRVLRPVMNSLRTELEPNPFARGEKLSARPIPINQRPLDNEYAWKGNPYQMDGWLKPIVTMFQFSCDDPLVGWFSDSTGAVFMTLDGGMSWRPAPQGEAVTFPASDFKQWLRVSGNLFCRITEQGQLEISRDQGQTGAPSMKGWRVPRAASLFLTPHGVVASGPGGCYQSADGENWTELKLWRESETGAADFLHAYWMGRYYGFVKSEE